MEKDETIFTIEQRKSDFLLAMKDNRIEVIEEQFEDFMNKIQKDIKKLEKQSIVLGWEMINSMLDNT